MIQNILEFIRQDKKFAALCLLVVVVYGGMKFYAKPAVSVPEAASAVSSPQASSSGTASEKKPANAKEELEALQKKLKENPKAAAFLTAIGFCIISIFSLGLIVFFGFLYNPAWRDSWNLGIYDVDTTQWRLSMLLRVVVYFLAASFAVNLILVLIQQYLFTSLPTNFILLFQTTVVDILCLVFIVTVVRQNGGEAKDVGFKIPPKGAFSEVVMGIIGYLGVFPVFVCVLVLLAVIAQIFSYQPPAHPLVNILLAEDEKMSWLVVYSVILATLVAPFLEEVFFRGFCYTLFKRKWGAPTAMVASSLFFAVIHENMFAFWPIFILGLALAYVYEKRGSLIAPVVLHLVHNSTFIFYFFLAKNALGQG